MADACPHCGADLPAGARFCPDCGTALSAPIGAERRLATMVFADLVGSTQLASGRDPEELRAVLERFFEAARAVLEEHGGTVEKYIGDAVMAVFGAPVAYGDDPDRAVRASLDLVERVAELGGDLAIRIGVNTGEVLASPESGADLSVTGAPVNVAARLQQHARPGQVLVGERTARACRLVVMREVDPVPAKGLDEPLRAFQAVEKIEMPETRRVAPLVGRDDDLDLLRLVTRRAFREHVPQLVTVLGDAGIGKTRLLEELVGELSSAPDPPRVLVGRSLPYGRGIAFWALGEIVRQVAGTAADAAPAAVHAALAERLAELGATDAEELSAVFAAALGAGGPLESLEGDTSVEDRLERAWRRMIGLLAAESPLVLVLDDLHWAGSGVLDLIESITHGLEDAPILGPVREPARAARAPAHMGPGLAQRDAARAASAAPRRGRPARARAAAARGAPPCRRGGGRGRRQPLLRGGDRPPDRHLRRQGRRAPARHGAGRDRRAHRPAPRRGEARPPVRGGARPELPHRRRSRTCSAARRRRRRCRSSFGAELLQERVAEGAEIYGFRHGLVRDVAYKALPRTLRRDLHERAADWLDQAAGERHAELAELVAFHLERAARLLPTPEREARAFDASVTAAEAALRRGATSRAQHLFEQAAEHAAAPADALHVLRSAAEIAKQRFRGAEALRLYRAAGEAAEQAGDAASAAANFARVVETASRFGGLTADAPPLEEQQRLIERARELTPPDAIDARARLLADEAWIHWRGRNPEAMQKAATEAVALARQGDNPFVLSGALDAAMAAEEEAGRLGVGAEFAMQRADLLDQFPADTKGSVFERIDIHAMVATTLGRISRFEDALEWHDRARELEFAHDLDWIGWSRGLAPRFFLGDWDVALSDADKMRAAWKRARRPYAAFLASSCAPVGAIYGYRGDDVSSTDWFTFTEELLQYRGLTNLWLQALRADVELHHGCIDAAIGQIEVPTTESNWWRSMFEATRAEAIVRAEREDAAEALQSAERWADADRYAQAVNLRTRGLLEGEEAPIREGLALFREIGARYQAARTGILLGGEERAAGEAVYAELGVELADAAPA